MAGEICLTGIVLGSMPVGDYDRRLSLLTCERGRISAFARGARRPMSSLRAASRLFTYAKFTVYAGKDSYSVSRCDDPIFFDEMIMDPEKTYYGMYFCELMEYFTRENSDEKEQVKLLFTGFRALVKGAVSPKLIRRVFELRAIANYGEAPNVFECSGCRKKEGKEKWLLDIKGGALYCEECYKEKNIHANDPKSIILISETVRYTMHYSITSPYKTLFGFDLTEEVKNVFEKCVDEYMKNHIDKSIKTLELLDTLSYNVGTDGL